MVQRQKRNRPAKMTCEEAQHAARMIRECLAEDGINETDSIGIFVYGIAQTLRAMQMTPSEYDPTLYTITRMLEQVAQREGAIMWPQYQPTASV
jgi:hypothetical protein